MILKDIITTDFVNYKKPSMYLAFPTCTWKCERDCGVFGICQNSKLAKQQNIEVSISRIIDLYKEAEFGGTKALLFCGLEPLDSFEDVIELISEFRKYTDDDVVIYTGYYKEELVDKLDILKQYKNIIMKFGRFRLGDKPHYDEVLGVELASDNQYAEKIS